MAAASHRPTLWDVKFTFTGDRTFSLPCKGCGSPVETSAFNAEAPTEPAGETVGCHRQLGGIVRLILYGFIKSLSHFFVPKNDSSLYKGAFDGQGQALSLRIAGIFLYHISQKLSYINNNLMAAASHRPTLWDVKFNLCFRPIFEGAVVFSQKK